MRAVVQRVVSASVTVGDEVVSSIGRGLCVLIGISRDDTKKDMEYIVKKILNLKVFEDDSDKKWKKSVSDKNYEVLCVSQFTLYCTLKGNKPDYHLSMKAEESEAFYRETLNQLGLAYNPDKIKDGKFGALMQVNIQNDGPVTISLESPTQDKSGNGQKKQKQGKDVRMMESDSLNKAQTETTKTSSASVQSKSDQSI